jgi:hypothetical protein
MNMYGRHQDTILTFVCAIHLSYVGPPFAWDKVLLELHVMTLTPPLHPLDYKIQPQDCDNVGPQVTCCTLLLTTTYSLLD